MYVYVYVVYVYLYMYICIYIYPQGELNGRERGTLYVNWEYIGFYGA